MRTIDNRALEASHAFLLKRRSLSLRIILALAAAAIALSVQAAMTPVIGSDKFVLWLVPMILVLALTLGGSVALLALIVAIGVDWFVYVGEPMTFALDRAEAVLIVGSLVDALLVILVCVVVRALAIRSAIAIEDHRVLSGELRHRIRNMLTVIGSIARQSFRPDAPVQDGWQKFDARLAALADVHGLASHGEAKPVALREMIDHALAPFDAPGAGRATVEGPDVMLQAEAVMPFRLAIHELATNALKYGAFSQPAGRLRVSWFDDAGQFEFHWTETGCQIASPPKRTGFGSRIIRQYLASRLGGTSALDFAPDGLRVQIDAPAANVIDPG
ncbi:sensor histidine kinase [Sphingomonas flavescens]|uniref:sensor histidine kinase n=1 Tax=Sphingomonas flavescens TaxID=3132797 RepID=UPI002805BB4D|nr:sensor histidine kinase [Sphingomonas limnosediminicola]